MPNNHGNDKGNDTRKTNGRHFLAQSSTSNNTHQKSSTNTSVRRLHQLDQKIKRHSPQPSTSPCIKFDCLYIPTQRKTHTKVSQVGCKSSEKKACRI